MPKAAYAVMAASLLCLARVGIAAEDSDSDGVYDAIDRLPCDPNAASVIFAPAEGVSGTVIFEDRWPAKGDLDFNDTVIGYNYQLKVNTEAAVTSLRLEYHVIALGGDLDLGFGVQLPFPRTAVASVTREVDGVQTPLALVDTDSLATFTIDGRARQLFTGVSGRINSDGARTYAPKRVVVDVVLATPQPLPGSGLPPYDLFIFHSADRGHEIHLPQYNGTSKMKQSLFGTGDDGSLGGFGQSFIDDSRLPFALVLPASTPYPYEGVPISSLMPNITAWASSGGTQFANFYSQGLNLQNSFSVRAGLSLPNVVIPPLTPDISCILPSRAEQYRLGHYYSRMSNSLPSTDAGDMKQAPDTALLVQHLVDRQLNFYGQRAELAYFYNELVNVLNATAGTGIEIFAFMGSKPCKWNGGAVPWNTGVSSTSGCSAAEKQTILENAVRDLATLSLTYPHFVGFTIDDFPSDGGTAGMATNAFPNSMTPAQIAAVMAVRDSVNPSFKFWPTTYTVRGQFSEISADSYHLGNGWGEEFNSGSSASLVIEYLSPNTLLNITNLTFGFADTFNDFERLHTSVDGRGNTRVGRINKEILVNGTMMFQQDITADDYPRAFVEDISTLWRPGMLNRIEIRLTCKDTYGGQNKYFSGKRLNVWGLSLTHNGQELIDNGATISLSSVSTNANDAIATFENTTHDYLSAVDGFLLVQPLESGYFSDEAAADLVRVSRAHLGPKDYISVNLSGMGYNWRFRPNIDPVKNGKAIAVAAAHADGVVIWNHPVNMHYRGTRKGVFAERSPAAALSSTEDLLLFHPKYQPTFYDWYQSYTWSDSSTSNLTFSLRDTTLGSASTTDEALVKYVLRNDDPTDVLYRDPLAGTECSADTAAATCPGFASTSGATCQLTCTAGREVIDITLPSAADEVTVKMQGEAHNSDQRWTYIAVPGFDSTQWTFDTNVSVDMQNIYDGIHDAFDQVRQCAWQEAGGAVTIVPPFLPVCCSDGFDNDGDGLVDSADSDCTP